MRFHRTLRTLIPAGVFIVFLCVMGLSLLTSITQREKAMVREVQERGQRDVARLARHAERFLGVEPQAIAEDITQLATDQMLQVAVLIDPEGVIRFSNHVVWRNQPAGRVLPEADMAELGRARQTRVALVKKTPEKNRLLFVMSYAAPSGQQQLRGLDRGVIYLAYDLSHARGAAQSAAFMERIPELAALVLAALILVWVLHTQVTRPLGRIRQAAEEMADGQLQSRLDQQGPEEIRALTTTFNRMSAQLANQVEQLADQVSHTQTILDNAIDGIITIDAKGMVSSFNKSAVRIFGYLPEEVIGNNVKMLMPEPYHSEHDGYLHNYLSTGVARIIGIGREVVGRRKDGSVFPMDLAVSEIQHRGKPLFIGMVRDITERKRIDRMKNEFVSIVSHELRTPLTAIVGSLGLLAGGALGPLPARVQEMLVLAQKNSQRLTHLINDLLDMEKLVAGKMRFDMQAQDLMQIVEHAVSDNQAYADQYQVRLNITQRVEGIWVEVDAQRMQQVLANLLSNAAKFSPVGGTVEIKVRKQGESVRVEVSDRGPGIPEAFRGRLFEKFAQADASDTRQKGGTGLGLAITRELVERMRGRIGFESIEGEGTTFYFELPGCLA